MALALMIFGVAFAAFCVWLVVRIVNRRERWAKWTAVGLAVILVAYPMSLGPMTGLVSRGLVSRQTTRVVQNVFTPLQYVAAPHAASTIKQEALSRDGNVAVQFQPVHRA